MKAPQSKLSKELQSPENAWKLFNAKREAIRTGTSKVLLNGKLYIIKKWVI